MKKKITNAQHFKKAQTIYEKSGQIGVFDYANKNKIGYEFCKACETKSPSIKHTCLVCGQETNKQQPMVLGKQKYVVAICRTGYGFKNIEVEAVDENEARELAINDAGNHEFSEKDADYSTNGVTLAENYEKNKLKG